MKLATRILIVAAAIVTIGGVGALMTLRASLPMLDGTAAVEGLAASVSITSDEYGVPTIMADSRSDAFRALGYVTARDRLFQMDLMRRSTAGTLAEVVGQGGVENDIKQRKLGLHHVARKILAQLPPEQRDALNAYTEGVNSFLAQRTTLPFEFLMLGYKPESWRAEDSLLVVLAMFQMLNLYEDDERMRTVMAQTLPPQVMSFLLPNLDLYTHAVLRGSPPEAFQVPIPVDELLAVRRLIASESERHPEFIQSGKPVIGSNGWVLAGFRSADGRAMLANDMHLDMTVPNTWYRVRLRYEQVDMMGLVIPGDSSGDRGNERPCSLGSDQY